MVSNSKWKWKYLVIISYPEWKRFYKFILAQIFFNMPKTEGEESIYFKFQKQCFWCSQINSSQNLVTIYFYCYWMFKISFFHHSYTPVKATFLLLFNPRLKCVFVTTTTGFLVHLQRIISLQNILMDIA